MLMRVDGSLMGIDDKANTLIPQWKRGHFSLLFDGRPTPATLLLVDHRKKTVVDLTKEKRKHRPDIDDEVSIPMPPAAAHMPREHSAPGDRRCHCKEGGECRPQHHYTTHAAASSPSV